MEGGRGRLPGSLPGGPAAGCSQPPGRHKGAQVINWSKGDKLLKRYSAKPCSGAAACTPPAPAHAGYLFIYSGCHRYRSIPLTSAISHPAAGPWVSPTCSSRQATIDRMPRAQGQRWVPVAVRQLGRTTSPPGTRPHCTAPPAPVSDRSVYRLLQGPLHSAAKTLCVHHCSCRFCTAHSPSLPQCRGVNVTSIQPQPDSSKHRSQATQRQTMLCDSCPRSPGGDRQCSVSGPVPRTRRSLAEAFLTSSSCRQHRVCSAPRCPCLPTGGNHTLPAHWMFSDQFQ